MESKSEVQQFQPRLIAHIVSINDILSGEFHKEDGWNPNFVRISGKNVSRINIMGVVLNCAENGNVQDVIIDDGSGKMTVRNFEKKIALKVGDVVHVIGRIREYGNERFISPEVMRSDVDSRWSLVWKKNSLKNSDQHEDKHREVIETVAIKNDVVNGKVEGIISKIKELDDGDGARYEEIVKIFKDETTISNLIMRGDVFEVKPGKLKVLD